MVAGVRSAHCDGEPGTRFCRGAPGDGRTHAFDRSQSLRAARRGPVYAGAWYSRNSDRRRYPLIKRVEINYRGIFQKNLGKKIGSDIVIIASGMGRIGFSNGRYSDSPERNGIPCKYFAFVSHDLSEEELEAECGAKLDIDEADVSVVVDDTMVKGVEPWGWHGIRPINEKVIPGGAMLVVSRKSHDDLLKFVARKPYPYRVATIER